MVLGLLLSGCVAQAPEGSSAPSSARDIISEDISAPEDSSGQLDTSSQVTLPSQPISFAPLPNGVETAPLEESSLPPLEGGDGGELPTLYAWKLHPVSVQPEGSTLEVAAQALWDSYTQEEWSGGVRYCAPVEQMPEGEYQETITLDGDGGLQFYAGWLDAEQTPFFDREPVDAGTALALARELATALGLESRIQVEPRVSTGMSSAHYVFTWPARAGGLAVEGAGQLIVRVIGDTAASLTLAPLALEAVEDEVPPAYLLDLSQAVYSVNYARSLAGPDSVFYQTPELTWAELVWTTAFAYPDYTPAYAFRFANGSGNMTNTVYVDAFTGAVATGTNEGGYPSPYGL